MMRKPLNCDRHVSVQLLPLIFYVALEKYLIFREFLRVIDDVVQPAIYAFHNAKTKGGDTM